jgi:hypothetical protein
MTTTVQERIQAIRDAHDRRRAQYEALQAIAKRMPGRRDKASERLVKSASFTLGPIASNATSIVRALYKRFKLVYINRHGQLTASRAHRKATYRAAIRLNQHHADLYAMG